MIEYQLWIAPHTSLLNIQCITAGTTVITSTIHSRLRERRSGSQCSLRCLIPFQTNYLVCNSFGLVQRGNSSITVQMLVTMSRALNWVLRTTEEFRTAVGFSPHSHPPHRRQPGVMVWGNISLMSGRDRIQGHNTKVQGFSLIKNSQ